MTFSHDELVDAIRKARTDDRSTPNSITSTELSEALGLSGDAARRAIRDAIKAGMLRPDRVWRMTMAGNRQRVAGYVLVKRIGAPR